jgi:hypothetical protein
MRPTRRFLPGSLPFLAAVALVAASLAHSARGHTHINPDGTEVSWYPRECCRNHDCRPVERVRQTQQGLWLTTVDGITIFAGKNDTRLPSRDMHWHVCLYTDHYNNLVIRCLFEPPPNT